MTLFEEPTTVEPVPRRRASRSTRAGLWALAVALVVLLALTFLPTSYVIQQPGPVYNTLGATEDSDGEEVPLIVIDGAETYDTAGALDLLTVQVVGNRERTPSWFELVRAWFDPTLAVVPIDSVFPSGQTTEQRDEESAALMVDSQEEATAAALTALEYDVSRSLTVVSLVPGAAADGVLEPGDVVVSGGGEPVASAEDLRRVVNAGAGAPVEIGIERDGAERTVSVAPRQGELNGQSVWLIGANLMIDFDFPFEVAIQLNDVGGPSAGMMFALGIIDTLTPGELNGGEQVAGTGTITADGAVGPIGGIRQKLWGAERAGARYFLAPEANCDEVVGHVPDGLRVFSVETLDDALAALDAVRGEGDPDALPTCTTTDAAAGVG